MTPSNSTLCACGAIGKHDCPGGVMAELAVDTMQDLMFCPVHKRLFDLEKLEPFTNCVACIRNERDELREQLREAKQALHSCLKEMGRA